MIWVSRFQREPVVSAAAAPSGGQWSDAAAGLSTFISQTWGREKSSTNWGQKLCRDSGSFSTTFTACNLTRNVQGVQNVELTSIKKYFTIYWTYSCDSEIWLGMHFLLWCQSIGLHFTRKSKTDPHFNFYFCHFCACSWESLQHYESY